ncbi:HAD-IC family P-type ATPase [Conexibacter woesei]|uniref:ATPase, P-type (Transporting), HAD superfamily, subfamily IC n=1 Tax=Conexibacter woesei (strain DSM 14684 / CCUG 47730 / CIP 108061 / JCM 11494 / NBRC 100937 / ID131577) TaxID=469383 RepID=D3F174_CONWI|nr:HAD-IC family P-type ATPase [Conexibacter woesei]ADB50150.1 ATPase, P-type (transporting), HAD superfamily, subfamily IC [Conexibacter woesei DSM 14684]
MTGTDIERDTRPAGLTQAEAERRLRERGPLPEQATSRSYRSIVVANTFTIFNLILAVFGAATIAFGNPKDALFLGILVANTAIGSFQEIRAKRALDKLAALVAPHATVVRDGEPRRLPIADVVVGDLVRVRAGDQVVADGTLVTSEGLALDESNLTGESEAVDGEPGRGVFSGSFVVEGEGAFEATAVGPDSRAARLAETARAFRHPRSPLEKAMDRLLIILVGVMVPLALGLGISLAVRDVSQAQAVETLTAAVVNIVPEGLILLVSLTAAVSAAKMARRGVLAQQLNAIESLASVSVMCTDKTGTLTEAALRVVATVPADGVGEEDLRTALGRFAASAPSRNGTLDAVHDAQLAGDDAEVEPSAQVPFSSRRRWSALELSGERFVLGAPEALLDGAVAGGGAAGGGAGAAAGGGVAGAAGGVAGGDAALRERAASEAATGRRVLALVGADGPLPRAAADAPLPDGVRPLGIVVLAERLRNDADRTVAFFGSEDVALKVVSGDNPSTVGAIARDAGIPAQSDALDGGRLPAADEDLLAAVRAAPAIGRISPEDKARVVRVLADAGEYVGMLGDGVNDVPALKQARLAIAQGSGTQMARSVSDLVLVSGEFGEVPRMVHEGRQILRNIQRVARLFVTKALFTAFLLLTIAIPSGVFPLLPRQFTLTSSLTIGIPAFFLALAPSTGPWRPEGFLKAIARFSLPAGLATGVGILSAYLLSRHVFDASLTEARSVTAATVVTAGLAIVMVLEDEPGKRRLAVGGLCALMALCYVLVAAIPAGRDFFDLADPTGGMAGAWAIGSAISLVLLAVALRVVRVLDARAEAEGAGVAS